MPDIINCRDTYLLLRNSKGNEPQSTFSYIDVKKTNQTRKNCNNSMFDDEKLVFLILGHADLRQVVPSPGGTRRVYRRDPWCRHVRFRKESSLCSEQASSMGRSKDSS